MTVQSLSLKVFICYVHQIIGLCIIIFYTSHTERFTIRNYIFMLLALSNLLMQLTPHDLIEILCCIMITHAILQGVYLKHGHFWYTVSYFYTLSIITSWLLSYHIMSVMLWCGSICAAALYFPVRSQTTITPSRPSLENNSWLEHIIALSIQGFHEDISLTWIIDYAGELSNILHAEISLHVYTVPKLSTIIFHTIDPHTRTSTLWVNEHGYIIGINPYKGITNTIPSADDMLMWSMHKGVIILQSHAPKRSYSIMHKGMVKDNLSSHHTYHLMKNLLIVPRTTEIKESSL